MKKEISKELKEFLTLKEINDSIKRYAVDYVIEDDVVISLQDYDRHGINFSIVHESLGLTEDIIFNAKLVDRVKKTKIQSIIKDRNISLTHETLVEDAENPGKKKNVVTIDTFKQSYMEYSSKISEYYGILKQCTEFIPFSEIHMSILIENDASVILHKDGKSVRLTKQLIPSWRNSKGKEDTLYFDMVPIDDTLSYLVIKGETYNHLITNYHIYKFLNVSFPF